MGGRGTAPSPIGADVRGGDTPTPFHDARPTPNPSDSRGPHGSDYLNLGRRWGDGSADRRLGEQVSIRSIRAGSIPGGWT